MPAPYSYDLRQKVIEVFQSGEGKSDVGCQLIHHLPIDTSPYLPRLSPLRSPGYHHLHKCWGLQTVLETEG